MFYILKYIKIHTFYIKIIKIDYKSNEQMEDVCIW